MAASGEIRAGSAYVELGARDKTLRQKLDAVEARIKSFGASITSVGAKVAAAGAGIMTPLFAAAGLFADVGSELADMSARTGLSVEGLSQLSYAAQQSGTDLATVESGVRKLQKNLTAAAMGSDQATVAFAELGLSAEELMKLSPDEQFSAVAGAIERIPNPSARAAAAMTLLGKSGTALLPMIHDLDDLATSAAELGLVMSTEDARAADALGDAFDTVKASLSRAVVLIGSALAPMLTDLAETLLVVIKGALAWLDANRSLVVWVFKVGAAAVVAGTVIASLGVVVIGLAAAFGTVVSIVGTVLSVLWALLSPVALVSAAVIGLAVYLTRSSLVGGNALAWLGDQFGGLLEIAKSTLGGISDALSAGELQLAAEILWAGLKLSWLKGTAVLKSIWADWGVAFLEVWDSASIAVSHVMVDLVDGLRVVWANLTSSFTGSWGDMIKGLLTSLSPLAYALEALGVDVSGILDKGLNAIGLETGQAEGNRQAALAAIGQDNMSNHKALDDSAAKTAAARRQSWQDAVAGAGQDVVDAQAELDKLTFDARTKALEKAVERAKGAKGAPELADFDPADLEAGIAATKAKADVRGSFNGSALAGLGVADSVAGEQLKEQKKANDHLDKLNRKADAGRLVFES